MVRRECASVAEVQAVDRVVSRLEAVLLPELERRRSRLAEDRRYAEARVVSLRHADALHTIGLSCHPVSAATAEESYSLHVNVIGLSGLGVRGFVGWHQPFIINRLPGYIVWEAMTRPCQLAPEGRIEEFLELLPDLWAGFERGLRRGRPPGPLRRWWNRLVFGSG